MTDLEEALTALVANVPGAVFAAVGGMDGLLVEQAPTERDELPELVAELTTVVSVARRAMGEILDGGEVEHLAVTASSLSAAIWIVSEDFYCLVVGRRPIDMRASSLAAADVVAKIRATLS